MNYFVHESSYVDEGAQIGAGSRIWHFSHISSGAILGQNCNLGQNIFIADAVQLGNRVKIQNNVSIYTGTLIEDDVFLGPSCVLTNISNPRSQVKRQHLYEKTHLMKGCTIGANATIVCGVRIGRYAFVGAGAVITKNVPDYALILGNPGQQKGWMTRHGHRLSLESGEVKPCPESGLRYALNETGQFYCLDLKEEDPLPEALSQGEKMYQDYKPL